MHEIGIEWMTQTEVNGHFLELRGIPDEKLEWERIPEAIAGANYYNIDSSSLSKHLLGKGKSCGKSKDNIRLKWKYEEVS